MLNLRNREIREEIKKRMLSETGRVPAHRQWEVETYLYLIDCYEREERRKKDEKYSV